MVREDKKKGAQITTGDDLRITKVGRILRKTKLDELPQLFNVLFGKMSLVGPRPEVSKYVELYNEEQLRVLSVKPGITDLASIEFRDENTMLLNAENPEEKYINEILPIKLNLNLSYIDNRSFFYDIMLIFKTILVVLK
jgi:lipopolysaccharide/colanic/teichoic acid biosynthesis glycosyltransferase